MFFFFFFFNKSIRIEHCIVLTEVLSMHVEGFRRAFLLVHNFKTFVDELYRVIMYEDQI